MSPVSAADDVVLAGRYRVVGPLGSGGMGVVRAADDLRLHRQVAIKALRPGYADDPDVLRRFEDEARSAARISHPRVVAIHDIGDEGGQPFIVMERLSGRTLADELRDGPLDIDKVRELADDLLGALGAAHRLGVVHRDIKPANLLVDDDGRHKVGDFGIAKLADTGDRTAAGLLLGTVAYLAPERVRGEPATVATDLYAAGVVLYEALSGQVPHREDTPVATMHAIATRRPRPLWELRPEVPADLASAVEWALAARPEDRPATAETMRQALAAPAGSETTVVRQPWLTTMRWRAENVVPLVRGRQAWVALGAVVLALGVVVGVLTSGGDGESARTPDSTVVPPEASPSGLAEALDRLEASVRR